DGLTELPPEKMMEAVDALIELLDDGGTREAAYRALTKLGPRVVPRLIKQLAVEDDISRREAAVVIGMIGEPAKSAIRPLMDILKDKDYGVRQAAAVSLGQMGQAAKEALPALKEALKDQHTLVRHRADVAIAQIEGRPIPQMEVPTAPV